MHQAIKELMMSKLPVTAITIMIQRSPKICAIQAMMRAQDSRFRIADEGVEPLERLPQIDLICFLGLMLAIRDGAIRGKLGLKRIQGEGRLLHEAVLLLFARALGSTPNRARGSK